MVIKNYKNQFVFLSIWILVFLFYLPAHNAGWVTDTTSWLLSLHNDTFNDYINRTHFGLKSLYQVTQLNTFLLFKIWGTNRWAWHVFFITLHALNSFLIFIFTKNILIDAKKTNAFSIAFVVALLFALNPYHTEVVLWKACFHYLQAVLLIFLILIFLQKFIHSQKMKFSIYATVLFLISIFSLELFYLTPVLVLLTICFYYWIGFFKEKGAFLNTLLCFFLPIGILFISYFIIYFLYYGFNVSHVGNEIFNCPLSFFALKPPDYLFHIVLWGRFWSEDLKYKAYHFISHPVGYGVFCLSVLFLFIYLIKTKFKTNNMKLLSYLIICLSLTIFICLPLPFFETLRIYNDRYTYLILVFYSMLLGLLLFSIKQKTIRIFFIVFYLLLNLCFLQRNIICWQKSSKIIDHLQSQLPINTGKIILILNSPLSLNGAPMLAATSTGEFKDLHNMVYAPYTNDTVFDVLNYNMLDQQSGAHIQLVKDSLIKIALNQKGHWWLGWREAKSYENNWYKVKVDSLNSEYELILKTNRKNYILFYQDHDSLIKIVN